jgi:hypothetical protein
MPERKTIERARKAKREGEAPTTQAGEFVHEEMEHIREGKHGARSTKQAIAIGLSKARRAGVKLPASKTADEETKEKAKSDERVAKRRTKKKSAASRNRSRGMRRRLQKEGTSAASTKALSEHAKKAARRRTKKQRSAAAKKAARTRAANAAS